ncbi:xanthine dehydrogenase accessory factor [Chryseobacterium sp. SORGH_AS 447]|uniref:XdhC family protein n=1 Tax=Chryseobacterium sp. SORGH_AS_0447 TaxID=3041769 RepID=UPI0027838BCA|nr:XdhC/CoxI family protein [Chryseobacterium sp. SORGH_AS_0447]MDQ1161472.1 xanthine dehydrogenase accessory factor [Chryseobacterium sp. SORGH_AS_0447]
MKEINDIIKAYRKAQAEGKKTALATVVKVEGSSYRQPGARMLVTEDGELTGAISGGCLEGDALKKALLAIHQQQNKLITYDTSNDEDSDFGVQLGCNGIVHILFEFIDAEKSNVIDLLTTTAAEWRDSVLTCLFSLERGQKQVGTVLFYSQNKAWPENNHFEALSEDMAKVLEKQTSVVKTITYKNVSYEALIEYIPPAVSLVIAGAGNDVKPLVEIASVMGWEITVAEGRVSHATEKRFPLANNIMVVGADDFVNNIIVDEYTFVVLMTHNYRYDLTVLKNLLNCRNRYIGVLGPKSKLNRMISDLAEEDVVVSQEQMERIYGPVGLDIGAETSEEIALSVTAEIKAVLEGKKGNSLRYKKEKIHHAISGDAQ